MLASRHVTNEVRKSVDNFRSRTFSLFVKFLSIKEHLRELLASVLSRDNEANFENGLVPST